MKASLGQDLTGAFRWMTPQVVGGFVVDANNLDCRYVVALAHNGVPYGCCFANAPDPDAAARGFGDGCYGFMHALPPGLTDARGHIEAFIANTRQQIGSPLRLSARWVGRPMELPTGSVIWRDGLQLSGWIRSNSQVPPLVRVLCDGDEIICGYADRWSQANLAGGVRIPVRRFHIQLPPHMADGRVRKLSLECEGHTLGGSPIAHIAFSESLSQLVERLSLYPGQRLQGELYDKVFPATIPFSEYEAWRARYPDAATIGICGSAPLPTVGVVELGIASHDARLSFQHAESEAVGVKRYCLPATASSYRFDPRSLRSLLDRCDVDAFLFMRSGTHLSAGAVAAIAAALGEFPQSPGAYGDLELALEGAPHPVALPAFSYERLLEQGYCAEVFALRRERVVDAISSGIDSLFGLIFSVYDRPSGVAPLVHVPRPLALRAAILDGDARSELARAAMLHVERRGGQAMASASDATFGGVHLARKPHLSADAITVVLELPEDTDGAVDTAAMLSGATASQMVVISPRQPTMRTAEIPAQMSHVAMGSCRARNFNQAARLATGEAILFLSGGVRPVGGGDFFAELAGRLNDEDVAAAGASVLDQGGRVVDAGFIGASALGVTRLYATKGAYAGYFGEFVNARECTALSITCLLVRRAAFETVGGFDAVHFPDAMFDVDFCLSLRSRALRLVWTPHAACTLASEAGEYGSRIPGLVREEENLRYRWGVSLAKEPYYNPILSRGRPYSGLAANPAPRHARVPEPPFPRPIPFY